LINNVAFGTWVAVAAGGVLHAHLTFVPEFRPLGLLNDDSTDVGRVHLGVVYLAEADGRPVAVRETEKLEGRFVAPAAVLGVYDRMETWSQLVFDFVAGRAAGVRGGTPGVDGEMPHRF
jgi:hypothetical protein